ncbi:MAG TPA: chemotaxis protein CheA, partial [Patescibacteria group bacterium]|nr:chemotaxis protein CheA [Patescibacteria group bacterium]
IENPEQADPAEGQSILSALAGIITIPTADSPAAAPPPAAAQPPATATGDSVTYRIGIRLADNVLEGGSNPLLLLDELRGLGDCTVSALTETVPLFEMFEPGRCYIHWEAILTTTQPRSAIEDVFIFVLDNAELKIEAIEPEHKRLGEILVERGVIAPAAVEAALAQQTRLGSLLVKDGAASEDVIAAALAEQRHLRTAAEEKAKAANAAASSVRVPAERLDDLMDRVGELVIAQARLKQHALSGEDLHLKSIAEEMERLINELRGNTMGIRMVPIASLFSRFRRLVHDLSRDLGKDIVLTTDGEETELDKTVIERLNDPVVHLIRNSLDHGLESPEGRAAAGKPREGHVHLSATHSGGQVQIRIRDDGRGLALARIRAKAEANGIVAAGAKLSDAELCQIIFHPGFSTAAVVTSVSGRGVGMDVVKRTIDSLRGTVEIASNAGQGTEITLRLPLTLAIIDGLLVRVGRGCYVIPLPAIEECVELSDEDDHRSTDRSFLNIRDELLPFLRLRELFLIDEPIEPFQKVVVVASGDLRVGLVVDQVIGEHQTVIKSLSKLHANVPTFSGATILGDGTVALILDIAHLVEFGQQREERRRAS